MKRIMSVVLILAVFSLGAPLSSFAADQPSDSHQAGAMAAPAGGETGAGMAVTTPGVVAAAVSVLGFIALAASVDSGDATPTTTNH